MSRAASFPERWARDNLTRTPSADELVILDLMLSTCEGDEAEASKRARRYYRARGPSGLPDLWHRRHPDDEEILSSCQDVYIVPLRTRSVGGRRMTLVRLPAPTSMDKSVSVKALLARWLMILDIRLREDPTPGEEVVFIDVCDLQPSHLKKHFRGSYWKDFVWCMKGVGSSAPCVLASICYCAHLDAAKRLQAYPLRFAEVHVINTHRLKTITLLLLRMGVNPWRKKVVQTHANAEQINHAMGVDFYPVDGLPYEYGGKAGAMKDLNDEWTKKLLSNSKWLQSEERKYFETELKPLAYSRSRHRSAVRNLRGTNRSYDMATRTLSCRSLNDLEEGPHGSYRTLKYSDRQLLYNY